MDIKLKKVLNSGEGHSYEWEKVIGSCLAMVRAPLPDLSGG